MTEEQIKKMQWLNRAYFAEGKIKALEAVREKNQAIAIRCNSYRSTEEQKEIIKKLHDDVTTLKDELFELASLRMEIRDTIATIENNEYEAILNMRYLAYMKMQEIADLMGYDRKTIQRKHKSALEKLSLNVALEP